MTPPTCHLRGTCRCDAQQTNQAAAADMWRWLLQRVSSSGSLAGATPRQTRRYVAPPTCQLRVTCWCDPGTRQQEIRGVGSSDVPAAQLRATCCTAALGRVHISYCPRVTPPGAYKDPACCTAALGRVHRSYCPRVTPPGAYKDCACCQPSSLSHFVGQHLPGVISFSAHYLHGFGAALLPPWSRRALWQPFSGNSLQPRLQGGSSGAIAAQVARSPPWGSGAPQQNQGSDSNRKARSENLAELPPLSYSRVVFFSCIFCKSLEHPPWGSRAKGE